MTSIINFKLIAIFVFGFFVFQLTGCATALTENDLADREYDRQESLRIEYEGYLVRKARCKARSGMMIIMPSSGGSRIPRAYTREDYLWATCSKR